MIRKYTVLLIAIVSFSAIAQKPNFKLLTAARSGDLATCQLLAKEGASLNGVDANGAPVLMYAVQSGNEDLVRWMVQNGADAKKKGVIYLDDTGDNYYGGLVQMAAGEGYLGILKFLINECKIDPNDIEIDPKTGKEGGWTSILAASFGAKYDEIVYLISKKANLNEVDVYGGSPVYYAAASWDTRSVVALLNAGARSDITDTQGMTALHIASRDGMHYMTEALLKAGAAVNGKADGYTPLYLAALQNRPETCKLLLQYKADPSITGPDGRTPLRVAQEGNLATCQAILKNPKSTNPDKFWESISIVANQMSKGLYETGAQVGKRFIEETEDQYGKKGMEYPIGCNTVAKCYKNLNKWNEALPLFEQAHKAAEYTKDPSTQLTYGADYAWALMMLEEYDKAGEVIKQIDKEVLGRKETFTVVGQTDFYNTATRLEITRGNFIKGREWADKGVLCTKSVTESKADYALFLGLKCMILDELGNYFAAKEIGLLALSTLQTSGQVRNNQLLELYNKLGEIDMALSDYEGAGQWFEKLRLLLVQQGQQHTLNYMSYLSNQGLLHHHKVEYDRAEKLYLEARDLAILIGGEQHSYVATAYNNLGSLYSDLGKDELAIETLEKALAIYKAQFGEEHPKYLNALNSMAVQLMDFTSYTAAEKILNDVLKVYKERYGVNHSGYAISLANYAELCRQQLKFNESHKAFEELKPLMAQLHGAETDAYATVLNNNGKMLTDWGHLREAEQLLLQAEKIRKEIIGIESDGYAETQFSLGRLYSDRLQFDKAISCFERASSIKKKIHGAQSKEYMRSALSLATQYQFVGRIPEAKDLYDQSLTIASKVFGSNNPEYGAVLSRYGLFLDKQFMYGESIEIHQKALAILLKAYGKGHREIALAKSNLATVNQHLGDLLLARKQYEEALDIMIANGIPAFHPDHAHIIVAYAQLIRAQGRFGESELVLNEAGKAILKGEREADVSYFKVQYSLASLLVENHILSRGQAIVDELVVLEKKLFGGKSKEILLIKQLSADLKRESKRFDEAAQEYLELGTMCDVYYQGASIESLTAKVGWIISLIESGQFDKVVPVMKKVEHDMIEVYEKTGNPGVQIGGMMFLAASYFHAEKYTEAKEAIGKVLDYEGLKKPERDQMSILMGQVLFSMGEIEAAGEYLLKGCVGQVDWFKQNYVSLGSGEKEEFYGRLAYYQNALNKFIVNVPRDKLLTKVMLENRLATKGVIMDQNLQMRELLGKTKDPELIKKYKAWKSGKEFLARLSYLDHNQDGSIKTKIDSVTNAVFGLEKDLAQLSGVESQLGSLDFEDITKVLLESERAVEIVRVQNFDKVFYAAIIYGKDFAPRMVNLENGVHMETKGYKFYSNAIQHSIEDKVSYDLFWKPLEEHLKGASTVYISSAGVYNRISLGTLWDPVAKKYLLEKYDLHFVTNTSDVVNFSRKSSKLKEAVFFGRPLYDPDPKQHLEKAKKYADDKKKTRMTRGLQDAAWLKNNSFADLPGTEVEVKAIDDVLTGEGWNVKSFTGIDALEESIKQVRHPTVLHIATHGFFREQEEEVGNAQFDRLTRGTDATSNSLRSLDPMLRSGIVMAGVGASNDATEDGLLTAYEASLLDLRGTELVVLSACETGLGELRNNGESVFGLQRAFTAAGAKSIVMSMWKVDDEATQLLMTQFYTKWMEHGDKRKAFRQAQSFLRNSENFNSPKYWGAFVMTGE